MKNNNFSIAAFSIVEAIVAMAVAAIIMGLTFVVFSIITERMLDYKNQNQLVNDLNRLTFSINKDIFDTEKMDYSDAELQFIGYSGEQLKYIFEESNIIRYENEFVDTFKIAVKQINVDSIKSKSQQLVFQKIKLAVEVNKKQMQLRFYKRVYANQLLEKMNEK